MTPSRETKVGACIRTYTNVVNQRRAQFGFRQSGLSLEHGQRRTGQLGVNSHFE